MEELVEDFAQNLLSVAEDYEELYSGPLIELLSEFLEEGFIDNLNGAPFEIREELGMFTIEGNLALQDTLQNFFDQAIDTAVALDLKDPLDRREILRNEGLAEFLSEDWWE